MELRILTGLGLLAVVGCVNNVISAPVPSAPTKEVAKKADREAVLGVASAARTGAPVPNSTPAGNVTNITVNNVNVFNLPASQPAVTVKGDYNGDGKQENATCVYDDASQRTILYWTEPYTADFNHDGTIDCEDTGGGIVVEIAADDTYTVTLIGRCGEGAEASDVLFRCDYSAAGVCQGCGACELGISGGALTCDDVDAVCP